MDKRRIIESFSRAAGDYDGNSPVQAEAAGELAELIRRTVAADMGQGRRACVGDTAAPAVTRPVPASPGRILDVGCGTGALTGLLAESWPGCVVTALDIALPMAERARDRGSAANVVAADCDELPFADGAFDVVASNMAYQWSASPEAAFAEAARVLAPVGFLIFSTLGPGTFTELNQCLAEAEAGHGTPSASFAKAAEIRAALEGAGLDILSFEVRPTKKIYRDMWELLRKVKRIGASPRSGKTGTAALRKAARICAERFPAGNGEGITATYEIIYVTAARRS